MISGKIAEVGHLVGVIQTTGELESLVGIIQTQSGVLSGQVSRYIGSDVDIYDGDYIVIPKPFDDQEFNTKGLLMKDDLTVLQIPYYETSNIADGLTVYIGGE